MGAQKIYFLSITEKRGSRQGSIHIYSYYGVYNTK